MAVHSVSPTAAHVSMAVRVVPNPDAPERSESQWKGWWKHRTGNSLCIAPVVSVCKMNVK